MTMKRQELKETRAVARLPHLEIEILHRRPWGGEGEGEQVMISLRAQPSFEAFGRYLETADPLRLWSGLMQAAWAPWFSAFAAASAALQTLAPARDE